MNAWLRSFRQGLAEEWRLLFAGRRAEGALRHPHGAPRHPAPLPGAGRVPLPRARRRGSARRCSSTSTTPPSPAAWRWTSTPPPSCGWSGRPASLEEGRAALRRGEAELLLIVPSDLSRNVKRGERAQLAVWGAGGNMYTWSLAFPAAAAVVASVDAELAARTFLSRGPAPRGGPRPRSPHRHRRPPALPPDRLVRPLPRGGDPPRGHPAARGGVARLQRRACAGSAACRWGRPRTRWPTCSGMAAAHAPFWLLGLLLVPCVVLPWMGWSGPQPRGHRGALRALRGRARAAGGDGGEPRPRPDQRLPDPDVLLGAALRGLRLHLARGPAPAGGRGSSPSSSPPRPRSGRSASCP